MGVKWCTLLGLVILGCNLFEAATAGDQNLLLESSSSTTALGGEMPSQMPLQEKENGANNLDGTATSLYKKPPADNDENELKLPEKVKTKSVTIDAAFGYNIDGHNRVYLLAGNSVQVMEDGVGQYVIDRAELNIPRGMKVTAAFVKDADTNSTLYYGESFGLFVQGKKASQAKYRALTKIDHTAPDAASQKADNVYLFKGESIVERIHHSRWVKPDDLQAVSLESMGLPSDVDAAWPEGRGQGQAMVILKGDQVWRWEGDGRVHGPHPFDKLYTLKDGWVLAGDQSNQPADEREKDLPERKDGNALNGVRLHDVIERTDGGAREQESLTPYRSIIHERSRPTPQELVNMDYDAYLRFQKNVLDREREV